MVDITKGEHIEMEGMNDKQRELEEKLDEVLARLERVENQQRHKQSNSFPWVYLIPIVAIIMWGLQNIF